MKLEGKRTYDITAALTIKNNTHDKTWYKWYREGETSRLSQQIGREEYNP